VSDDSRRRLRVGCEFVHELAWSIPFVLQVEPRADAVLGVRDTAVTTEPAVDVHQYSDLYGNACRRFTLGPGRTRIHYQAEVEVEAAVDDADVTARQPALADLPDDVLHYTLASRYCESDRLANTAWARFGDVPAGWARAQAVVDWVHGNVTFAHGSSNSQTSATDVYVQRRGVCRDFAHLAVALLRALNIPARYCFGYLPDIDVAPADEPMDFAAWLEAWVGNRWYTFDPRNNERRAGRVVIGRGRDALDTAMLTSYGSAPLTAMRVAAEPATDEPWSSARRPVVGTFEAALP
jgi:transglutaminase-like putative cysteine protease